MLTVAISSRALFDLTKSHQIFEQDGIKAYADYQIENEDDVLEPGSAFGFVKKLLAIRHPENDEPLVEVILLSRNSADTGLRIFNSIEAHKLNITRAAFTSGESPYQYISAFAAHLFLSAHDDDVRHALHAGCAAATLTASNRPEDSHEHIRIAFDGDAVLFSDEAEQIFQRQGLDAFVEHEKHHKDKPLPGGPFHGFLQALHAMQSCYSPELCPIRTALVTARNAPAHERVIKTLRAWQVRIDEAIFLGGMPKANFVQAFGADIFFDDQTRHCEDTTHVAATGHVPHGIMNES